MEPRIQYARTSDGVRIAYYSIGSGPPLVWMQPLYSHLQVEWQRDAYLRSRAEIAAQIITFVRYDHRGFGLSDREIDDYSLAGFVADIEAVVDRLGLREFWLMNGGGIGSAVAINFSVLHPERVSRLVLQNPCARLPKALVEQVDGLLAMKLADWRFVSETITRVVNGWEDDAVSRLLSGLLRESITMESFVRFWLAIREWDASALLARIQCPTLLLPRRAHPISTEELARNMAVDIPDASLVFVDALHRDERRDQAIAAMISFLDTDRAAQAMAQSVFPAALGSAAAPVELAATSNAGETPSGTAVIFFADIADSTALTEHLGDAAFREKARGLGGALRTVIRQHAGTPIEGKLLGDGVLAVFTSAREAIEAALACGAAGEGARLPLHLGLHAGDVIREKDPDGRANVYGGAVNIASRISGLSAPGEVLVSDIVRGLARTSASVRFEDCGEQSLKGVGEPVRVWAVREGE